MNLLLGTFFEDYGFLIIMLVLFAAFFGWTFFKNKKDREQIDTFQFSLKPGDKVVTGSGIYGTVEKIVDTTDGKVVTLKVAENCYLDVNIGAICNIDQKTEVKEEPVVEQPQKIEQPNSEDVKAAKVETAEEVKPAEKPAEQTEEQPEVVEAKVVDEQKND